TWSSAEFAGRSARGSRSARSRRGLLEDGAGGEQPLLGPGGTDQLAAGRERASGGHRQRERRHSRQVDRGAEAANEDHLRRLVQGGRESQQRREGEQIDALP